MSDRSLAGRALLLLPFATFAAWSGNAAWIRAQHSAAPTSFVVGSMDDTIADTLETGDLVFFSRKLTALPPLAALHTWLLRTRMHPRYDHCGFIYVDAMGRKFVVEETLAKVHCRPYSARILSSEATEIVIVPLKHTQGIAAPSSTTSALFQDRARQFVAAHVDRASRVSLRQTVAALIDPAAYAPQSTETAPLFPSAALVVELYGALGLLDPAHPTRDARVTTATITPRHLAAASAASGGLVFNEDAPVRLGRPLPIRLL